MDSDISDMDEEDVQVVSIPRKKKTVTKLYVWIARITFDQIRDSLLYSFFSLIRMYSIPAFYSI